MRVLLDLELLGLPPTVNQMYRTGKRSRYKVREVREYQRYVVGKLIESWEGKEAYIGRVELWLLLKTDNHRRWDIDNRVKALQDCLSMAGVIKDDSQLEVLYVERVYGNEKGTRIILKERSNKI